MQIKLIKKGKTMKLSIRRNIHETSSSSASALVMVTNSTDKYCAIDKNVTEVICGCFCDNGDGRPHTYLSDFWGKCSYLLQNGDERLVEHVVKKRTNRNLDVYYVWEKDFDTEDIIDKNRAVRSQLALDLEKYPYIKYFQLWNDVDYVILPKRMNIESCGYRKVEWYNEPPEILFDLPDNIKEKVYEEILFNDGFAIDFGGDAYCNEQYEGVPGAINISPEDYTGETIYKDCFEALHHRPYSALNNIVYNGNEMLFLGADGSKIRVCTDNEEKPEYPESIDLKITDQCAHGCAFCYEDCTVEGKHASLNHPFLKTLPSFVELAVGGGNPILHPELDKVPNLTDCVNITIHERDFIYMHYSSLANNDSLDAKYPELNKFNAIGVSLSNDLTTELLECFKLKYATWSGYSFFIGCERDYKYVAEFGDNSTEIVFHIVNGVIEPEKLKLFYDKGAKLLILGFKEKGRGKSYLENNDVEQKKQWMYDNIEEVLKHFKVVAFDTLAMEQLNIKRFLSDEDYEKYYMGDDGSHSMYIDLVKGEFGISSTDNRRWPLTNDIKEMFSLVRQERLHDTSPN